MEKLFKVIEGIIILKNYYCEIDSKGYYSVSWGEFSIKKNGKEVANIKINPGINLEKYNFFYKNRGNFVATIFECENKIVKKNENGYQVLVPTIKLGQLVSYYLLNDKKNTYTCEGFLKMSQNNPTNAKYYLIKSNLNDIKNNQNSEIFEILIKNDSFWSGLFEKCTENKNKIKIIFEKNTKNVLDFEILE